MDVPEEMSGSVVFSPSEASRPMWDALVHDSGAVVMLLTSEGEVLYANQSACDLTVDRVSPYNVQGVTLSTMIGPELAGQIVQSAKKALASGKPLVAKVTLPNGERRTKTLRPVRVGGPGMGVLLTCRSSATGEEVAPDAGEVVHEQSESAGRSLAASLTPREIEVLTLIAHGLSSAEIARRLHRSAKTIEAHRAKLGQKLGARNRSDLTRMALAAGLIKLDEKGSALPAHPGSAVRGDPWRLRDNEMGRRPVTSVGAVPHRGGSA